MEKLKSKTTNQLDSMAGKSEELADRLELLLQEIAAQRHIPSVLMAVEKGDRSFTWVGATGDAQPDGTQINVETPIFIASITKLFIASTLLRLYEKQQLDLDQPFRTYLTGSQFEGLHRLNGADYTDQITLRHLISHRSGLPEYLEDRPKGGRSFVEGILEEDHLFTIDDILDFVGELPAHFPPQTLDAPRQKVRYCDTNFQLLIEIIKSVTGRSLQEAFTKYLYQPLGLEQSYHPGDRPESPEPAALWVDNQPVYIPLAMRSFGDLISTVDDLISFMRSLIDGKVFDDAATLQMMMGHWHAFGFSLNPVRLSPGWPIEYSMGMMRFKIPRLFSPFRSVPAVVGHSGATGSWLFYCEDLDFYLAGAVNQLSAGAVPFRFIPKILQAVDSAGM